MEIILLILAGVVIYYLYITLQDYLKNPISVESNKKNTLQDEYDISKDPYVQEGPLGKIKKTEYGVMISILSRIFLGKEKLSRAKEELISDLIEDMSELMSNSNAKEDLKNLFFEEQTRELEELYKDYVNMTYGEYKKRLKFIEFLFLIACIDGKLEESYKENIIDMAAILELENEDFNKVYDAFENFKDMDFDKSKALEIFEFNEGEFNLEELDKKFNQLIKENHQKILDVKNLNKPIIENFEKLREITIAYDLLNPISDKNY